MGSVSKWIINKLDVLFNGIDKEEILTMCKKVFFSETNIKQFAKLQNGIINNMINSIETNHRDYVDLYRILQERLSDLVIKDSITSEDRNLYINQMIMIPERVQTSNKKNRVLQTIILSSSYIVDISLIVLFIICIKKAEIKRV